MTSNKRHKSWSDRVHECVVSRNKSGQLNLIIKGGAEEAKFPFFGPVKQDKVIYHSGKIQDGEILLEINDQSVAGLTLYDLNNFIKQAPDPVRFKTVKEGPTLGKDLKLYLSQRFEKGTVDHQLQAAIRDNLYLRSMPCTTRPLREGEVDGVDYKFLSIDEFQELDKSGALLESGIYEGNYYGTPKPPPKPLSSSPIRKTNSAGDLPGLHPSSDGKRKRNRSNIEQLSSSSGASSRRSAFPANKDTEKTILAVTTKEPTPTSHPTDDENVSEIPLSPNKELPIQASLLQSEKILGPLPEGWEMAQTESGDCYFIDHLGKKTSWSDPRLENKVRKKLEDCEDDELPYGWEKIEDPQYGVYYVDHFEKKTQYANPVVEAKKKLETPEEMSDTQLVQKANLDAHTAEQTDPTVKEANRYAFTTDPAKLRGVSHLVPIEKSSRGFGFTIVGGDDPEEFLQIKSVVPGGPAARTGNINQGDVIVKVNDTCVLGWTHPDVVKLFQAIPIGQIVTLQLCRGYPLMVVDSDDPSANLVISAHAAGLNNKSAAEAERQHNKMLSKHLTTSEQNGFNLPINDGRPSNLMSNLTAGHLHEAGYYANPHMLPPSNNLPQNPYTRVENLGQVSPEPIAMQVIIEKGGEGFGFTIADSPHGQKIKQILDVHRCGELLEGDLLLEVNGSDVLSMPHNNVVQILKDCPSNSSAIFIVQRDPPLVYNSPQAPAVSLRPNMNGPVPVSQYGYHMPGYGNRVQRSLMDSSFASGNPGIVTSPSGAVIEPPFSHPDLHSNYNMNYPRGNCFNAADRSNLFNTPISSNYQSYGGQKLYHDPYQTSMSNDSYIDLTVVLRREESGFGFRILGGNADGETVTIGSIVPNGAADMEGTLRYGDQLLTVDGQQVTRMGHNQVVSLMGNAARNAVVSLGIRRRLIASHMPNRPQKTPLSRPLGTTGSRPSSRGPGGPLVSGKHPFDIVIHRQEHEGFGFVIISSMKSSGATFHSPHKVGRLIEGSPAARCGRLRVGDRILAVNNADITTLHHGEIVTLIKESGFSIALRVLPREVDEDNDVINPLQNERDYKVAELQRSRKGFGFGIRGGREYNMPLYILRVAPDGPAAESGQVEVGDILLDINGHSTADIPHTQAISLIRLGGPTVKLILKPGDGKVPDLDRNPVGSMQSLSSNAVSGPDPANRAFLSRQQHSDRRVSPDNPPQSNAKSHAFNLQTTSSKLSRHGQSSMRHLRRRANSSGQILPEESSSHPTPRMRRAITPNPASYQEELFLSASRNDVEVGHSDLPDGLLRPANQNMVHRDAYEQYEAALPKSDASTNDMDSIPKHTSPNLTKSHETPKENGTALIDNSSTVDPYRINNGRENPKLPFDHHEEVPKHSASVDKDIKKSKKGKKLKSTKVGLWLSPKKKQK